MKHANITGYTRRTNFHQGRLPVGGDAWHIGSLESCLAGHVSPTNLRPQAIAIQLPLAKHSVRFIYTVMDQIRVVTYSCLPHVSCGTSPAIDPLMVGGKPFCATAFSESLWIVTVLLYLNGNTSRCTYTGFSTPETNSHLAKIHFVNAKERKTAATSSSALVRLPASPLSSSSLS